MCSCEEVNFFELLRFGRSKVSPDVDNSLKNRKPGIPGLAGAFKKLAICPLFATVRRSITYSCFISFINLREKWFFFVLSLTAWF